MITKELAKRVMDLYNSCIFLVDEEKKIIKEVYYGSTVIAKNISFLDLGHLLSKVFDLKDIFSDKLDRFITNLNTDEGSFYITLDYEKEDGSKIPFILRGYRYNENEYLIAFYPLETIDYETDELTKTIHKNNIINKAKQLINENKSFAIIRFGIDDFDEITKKHGGMIGDIILIETAVCIKNIIQDDGIVSRIGNSEFVIIFKIEDDYDVIHEKVSEIRHSVQNLNIHATRKIEIHSTIGCVRYPTDGDTFELLIKKAEIAYQRGIKKGKDNFVIYFEEKCGPVPNNYETEFNRARVPVPAQNVTYNITSGVIELLNRESELDLNFSDVLSIIGNFFLLDRICYVAYDIEENVPEIKQWLDPKNPIKIPDRLVSSENFNIWLQAANETGMIKFNQVDSNKRSIVYPLVKQTGATSILAFILEANGIKLGLLIFEMCSRNRFWTRDEVSSLRLISKVFAVKTLKANDEKKHFKALYLDPITGIYNYKKWYRDVSTRLQENPGMKYAILQTQIQDFNTIKSMIGTRMSEKIYYEIADKIGTYIFNNIIYCHDYDDHFIIFFPTDSEKEVQLVFEELANHIFNNSPIQRFKVILKGGAYIGCGETNLSSAVDKTSIALADASSPLTFFTNEILKKEQERTTLELHMHDALQNNEFLLYLQPKIDSITGNLVGAEALTRWNYCHKKLIFPNVFIPMFEENGFIERLDFNVFENTCKFQRKLLDEGKKPVPISLNVSRYISDYKEYIWELNVIRKKYKIPADLLEIEITEGMSFDNNDEMSSFIDLLHKHNYKVAMDDFGSGYSNLSSLGTLNFDWIKIDKSLISNTSEKQKIVLSSLISMIKNLNMNVICEGVETKETEDFLKEIGCTNIQGYLYDKPIPQEDFMKKYFK